MTDTPAQPDSDDGPPRRAELPRTERDEAPMYLAHYKERQRARELADRDGHEDTDDGTPLYLRRFRQRKANEPATAPSRPLWERSGHGLQQAMSEDNRNKEVIAPARARRELVSDVYLVRHGETQGYTTEAGLTPLGNWQAHEWGHTLSKRVKDGEEVVVASAPTNRASETARHIHKGLLDGLAMFEKDVKVTEPVAMKEFRNFAVATPDGLRDVTAAFRHYYAVLEEFERLATGDRPTWLVEIDRFWRTQQAGGDPIEHWLEVPMLHFEPPAMCVRRFWAGIRALADEHPNARVVIATHSGPIRAFAVAALGYDPGEPYNTEHVRVKILEGYRQATVGYRNRLQSVQVPDVAALPTWQLDEEWDGGGLPAAPDPTPLGDRRVAAPTRASSGEDG